MWTNIDGTCPYPNVVYLPPSGAPSVPQLPCPTRLPVATVPPLLPLAPPQMGPPSNGLGSLFPPISGVPQSPSFSRSLPPPYVAPPRVPPPPSLTESRSPPLYARRALRFTSRTHRPFFRVPLLTLPPSSSITPTYLPRTPYSSPPPFIRSAMFPYPVPGGPALPIRSLFAPGVDTPRSPDRPLVIDLTHSPPPPPTPIPTSSAPLEYDHRPSTRGLASISPPRSSLVFQRHLGQLIQGAFRPPGPFSTPPEASGPGPVSSPPPSPSHSDSPPSLVSSSPQSIGCPSNGTGYRGDGFGTYTC